MSTLLLWVLLVLVSAVIGHIYAATHFEPMMLVMLLLGIVLGVILAHIIEG